MSAVGKVVAAILLTPVVIVVAGIGGCEARKAYYDWRVRKLCEGDGGVTINERVRLSPDQAASMTVGGRVLSVPFKAEKRPDQDFYREEVSQRIRASNPELTRSESRIIRAADQKVLGRRVVYWRRGGDFPSPAHDSSFSCPKRSFLENEVFLLDGGNK
jgi:hypothetical protein